MVVVVVLLVVVRVVLLLLLLVLLVLAALVVPVVLAARETAGCRQRTAVLNEVVGDVAGPPPRTRPRDAGETAIRLGQGAGHRCARGRRMPTEERRLGRSGRDVGGVTAADEAERCRRGCRPCL